MISTFAFSLGGGGGVASAAPATYMACSTDSGFLVFYDFFGCPFGTHLVSIGGSGAAGPAGPTGPQGPTGDTDLGA